MSVNSISGNVAAFQTEPVKAAAFVDKAAKGIPVSNIQPSVKAEQASPLDIVTDNKISVETKKAAEKNNVSSNQSAGIVSHVVESYNQHGKVRVKFMDSRNNVVYQTPSEMVARLEDQMMSPNTSANVKG